MNKYSKEFKEKALKLSDDIGVKKAANQLGLQYYTLADWLKDRKAETKMPNSARGYGNLNGNVTSFVKPMIY